MGKEFRTFDEINKETKKDSKKVMCVVSEEGAGKYAYESIVGGENEKLEALKMMLEDFNNGKQVAKFVAFTSNGDQIKGGLEAVVGPDGIVHVLSQKDAKEVYLVAFYKNEPYSPCEGGKDADELARNAKRRHDGPRRTTGEPIYYMEGNKPKIDVAPIAPEKQ